MGISLYRQLKNLILSLDVFQYGVVDFLVTTKTFHFNLSWLENAFDVTLDNDKILLTFGFLIYGKVSAWFRLRRGFKWMR